MSEKPNRREVLGSFPAVLAAGLVSAQAQAAPPATSSRDPFIYCLNTSTIRGQKLSIVEEVELAARVGYQGIEPWINELDRYVEMGGKLEDLGKRIRDLGLTVESAIGFARWIVDDDAERKKGLEEARRTMEMVRKIGGSRIAAPPAGATMGEISLPRAAERYRQLLELGDEMGVVPEVEVWGFSRSLSRLGETVFVAVESGHPRACMLLDVYHLHKGGSGFEGLRLLNGAAMPVFHMNDYPDAPGRAEITDAHRVYPGDGVAPIPDILRGLRAAGFKGALSLELFNRGYWEQDAMTVARTGLEKMKAVVQKCLQPAS